MDFELSDDSAELRDLTRTILTEHVTPERLGGIEASGTWFDAQTWGHLSDAGIIAAVMPDGLGGGGPGDGGLGASGLATVLIEVGRTVAPVPFYATTALGALAIAHFGDDELRARVLPGVLDGATILTGAFEEIPGTPAVVAKRHGDSWVLTGRRRCVPAVHLASLILVPAVTDAISGRHLGFLVDPAAPGFTATRNINARGEPQFSLDLDSVTVAASNVVTAPDDVDICDWVRGWATLGACAEQLGVIERALEMTAAYVSEREQFGRKIGSFQAVSQRVADAYIDVAALRWTTWQAVSAMEHDATDSTVGAALAVAKYWCARSGHRVVHAAQHVHGGIGVNTDYPLHRYFLWAKHREISFGAGQEQLRNLGALLAAGALEW